MANELTVAGIRKIAAQLKAAPSVFPCDDRGMVTIPLNLWIGMLRIAKTLEIPKESNRGDKTE